MKNFIGNEAVQKQLAVGPPWKSQSIDTLKLLFRHVNTNCERNSFNIQKLKKINSNFEGVLQYIVDV